mgnify:CR=1 FL=1
MARSKIKAVYNEPWESNKQTKQSFTKICDDMLDSMAWHDLDLAAQGLYLFLKRKYTKNNGKDNANDIHLTKKDLRILNKSNNTIMKYLDELIENGFIKVVQHGKLARLPNIYGFSAEWKKYNSEDFFIHPNNKRDTKKNSYKVWVGRYILFMLYVW